MSTSTGALHLPSDIASPSDAPATSTLTPRLLSLLAQPRFPPFPVGENALNWRVVTWLVLLTATPQCNSNPRIENYIDELHAHLLTIQKDETDARGEFAEDLKKLASAKPGTPPPRIPR